jgi:hypothetical protein
VTPATDELDSWISRELGDHLDGLAISTAMPRYRSALMQPARRRRPGLAVAFAAACFFTTGGMIAASASIGGGQPAPVVQHR